MMSRAFNCLPNKKPIDLCRQYSVEKKTKHCRLGPQPRNCHDPPACYEPERLKTSAFKTPAFIKPRVFRPLQRKEVIGPNAGKCQCYKNPEYYSYHRFSIYDLRMFTNAVKKCIKCCE